MESIKPRVVANHIQAGVVQKTTAHVSVEFERRFIEPPVVAITPAFTAGVGAPETLHNVTDKGFELFSIDQDPVGNYYVHWIAVGDVA